MVVDAIASGFVLCLGGLFGLAISHKLSLLATSSAASDRLVAAVPFVRGHATVAVAIGAVLELTVVVAMLTVPSVGLTAAFVMLAAYCGLLSRLPSDEGCECFGPAVRIPDRRVAIRRNLVLAAICAAGVAATVGGVIDLSPFSAAGIAVAVLVAAAAVGAQIPHLIARVGGSIGA